MDKEDHRMENSEEDHHLQETAAGGSSGRILVKLKFPKMPEEEVRVESPAAEIPETKIVPFSEEAARTHCCKECGRVFSSGKALGGHMSSAHVQANKDLIGKKPMRSKYNKSGGGCSPSMTNYVCVLCPKTFPSKKSLFGHMRCHPERDWRGMEPPLPPLSPPSGHRITDFEEEEESSSDDQADSAPHEVVAAANPPPPTMLIASLKSWPSAAKRNRGGPIRSASDSPLPSYTSADTDVALAHVLVRMSLLKQIPFREAGESSFSSSFITPSNNILDSSNENQLTVFKDHKGDDDCGDRGCCKKLKICERDDDPKKMEYCNGKGKEKASPPSSLQSDAIDSDDETCLVAINNLINVKQVIESSNTAPPQPPSPPQPQPARDIRCSPMIVQESGISIPTPQKYTCDVCHKSFKSHQALGGHRSSHNKFKFTVFNTDDLGKNGVNIKKETAHGNGYEQVHGHGTKAEDDGSSYVCEVCKKVFSSGQALGGHKRCHSSSPPAAEEETKKTATKPVFDFDLNESPEPENGEV